MRENWIYGSVRERRVTGAPAATKALRRRLTITPQFAVTNCIFVVIIESWNYTCPNTQ